MDKKKSIRPCQRLHSRGKSRERETSPSNSLPPVDVDFWRSNRPRYIHDCHVGDDTLTFGPSISLVPLLSVSDRALPFFFIHRSLIFPGPSIRRRVVFVTERAHAKFLLGQKVCTA